MKKVLITDDTLFMRNQLREMLSHLGVKVIGEAVNGIEAIDKFKKLKPDIVFMDVTMPQMNGLDALRNILEIDCHAVVIMCSAMGQRDIIVESIQAGAFDYIVKPFNIYRISEAINRV